MKIEHGKHKILFSKGKLYLNGVQIAGEGVTPDKDVMFEFDVRKPEQLPPVVQDPNDHPSVLQVNVVDALSSKDIGPGQR